ncbi:MAG: hypothetical protein JOY54_20805 [Acidobacteriaceae bacterium]|nr:hypothetical protein [Acidobacteriaceae bacterium]
MKTFLFVTFAGCALAMSSSAGSDREHWDIREQETIQKTLTRAGPPMRLVIDDVDGYIHVTGTSGSQVQVTAHKTIRADTASDLQEAKNDVKLEITEKPGSVVIYYDAPWRCDGGNRDCSGQRHRRFYNVTYDIDVLVPRQARVVASTVNNGDVHIDKTAGDFDVSNVNGGIRMTEVSGSGDVHTVNGPVSVQFAKNPAGPASFKSLNGQLDIYFQPGLSADLLFKTFNGEIYSDFEVTPRAVLAGETGEHNGKFIYRSNGLKGARAGQGGPEYSFDAFNGNIRIHRAVQGAGK